MRGRSCAGSARAAAPASGGRGAAIHGPLSPLRRRPPLLPYAAAQNRTIPAGRARDVGQDNGTGRLTVAATVLGRRAAAAAAARAAPAIPRERIPVNALEDLIILLPGSSPNPMPSRWHLQKELSDSSVIPLAGWLESLLGTCLPGRSLQGRLEAWTAFLAGVLTIFPSSGGLCILPISDSPAKKYRRDKNQIKASHALQYSSSIPFQPQHIFRLVPPGREASVFGHAAMTT